MTTETASEDDNFGTAASNKVWIHLFSSTSLLQIHPVNKKKQKLFFVIFLFATNTVLWWFQYSTLICQALLTFDLLPPRLSSALLALRDVTVSSLASTWAVQIPSWWFDRLPSMCGRSWCQTPPELFGRSSQPSSLSCWVSWLPPALIRELYYSFSLIYIYTYNPLFICPLICDYQYLHFSVTVKVPAQALFTDAYRCVRVLLDCCSYTGRPGEEAGREDSPWDYSHPGGWAAFR